MTVRVVHHINCLTMCPVAGRWMGLPPGPSGLARMVAHCLVIETERDGLVLVDTGFGTRDLEGKTGVPRAFLAIVRPAMDPAEPAIAQISALGYRASDVRHVVVTHLDVDHAGGIGDFPDARVHLHAREHAAAIAPATLREKERYIQAHWSHGPQWEVYSEDGDTWRGLPAIARLRGIDADIGLLPMHGHTRGHSAVIVRERERWLVHAGDAYFHRNMLAGGRTPLGLAAFETLVQIDPSARKASAAALRELHTKHDDLDVFCAHDPIEYEAFHS